MNKEKKWNQVWLVILLLKSSCEKKFVQFELNTTNLTEDKMMSH